jgi:MFS transporter, DHA2 family, integral membrane protein
MGTVMPPSTEAVMSVVPRERAGAGSALTNVARQVSGALGVAVLGSILAQAYRARVLPALGALPAASRLAATQSVAATQAAAGALGRSGAGLLLLADRSFVHAMHITTVISAVIAASGAALIALWMPGLPRTMQSADHVAAAQAVLDQRPAA